MISGTNNKRGDLNNVATIRKIKYNSYKEKIRNEETWENNNEKGFQNEPQRCKPCRDKKKNEKRSPRDRD